MTTHPQDQITNFWSMVAPDYEDHGSNVAEYGTGSPVLPLAKSDDGLLAVCVLPCASRVDLLGYYNEHNYQRTARNNIPYLIVGTGGWAIYHYFNRPPTPEPVTQAPPPPAAATPRTTSPGTYR